MAKYKLGVKINKPVEQVWENFMDPENLPKWLAGLKKFEHVSGEPGTVGAKSKHTFENDGRIFELEEEITEVQKHRLISGKLFNEVMTTVMKSEFIADGDKTEFNSYVDTTFNSLSYKLMSPVILPQIKKRQLDDLNRFKKLVEETEG